MTVRHSAGSRSITGLRSSPLLAPALLTTMSTRPSSPIVRSASASTAARSATSETAVSARAPERPHLLGDGLDVLPAGGLLVVGVAVGRAAGAGQHDVAPGPGQLDGDRPPDRAHPAGARHDGHLVGQSGQLVRHAADRRPAPPDLAPWRRSGTIGAVTDWNFADVYEAIAAAVPDRPCQIHGDRVAHVGRARPARRRPGRRPARRPGSATRPRSPATSTTGPSTSRPCVAAFKAALVPVNTNFRYGPDEIRYLFDNADAEAVVFHASFAELLDGIRDRLPRVKRWYVVADEAGAGPGLGDAVRGRRRRPARRSPTGRRAAATTCCSSTPAARPACRRA